MKNINLDKSKSLQFLLKIIGNESANMYYIKNLLDIYPNTIEYILNDKTPDLTKVKYVKSKRWKYIKELVLENISLLQLNDMLENVFDITTLINLKEYYTEFLGPTYNDEIINNIILQNIKKEPYDTLCRISGINFLTADKILLNAYDKQQTLWNIDLKSSLERCTSFIIYFLLNKLNGSTKIEKNKLLQAMKYKYGLIECSHEFYNALNDYRLKIIGECVSLTNYFNEEKNISNFIFKALSIKNNWNININLYNEVNNFILTDDQLNTLKLINENQLVLLNGYAGTGKSSSIKALINMLEDNNKTYKILAPTAKAAKTISEYTCRHASTIHFLLCADVPDFDINISDNEYINISNREASNDFKYEKLDYDIIIIDECSMLSITLFNILLRYIDPTKTKLLLIGDSYQLPSIQNGNLYQDLLEINDIPKITLDKIFRYTEDGLINVATNIRLGNKYLTNESEQYIGESYSFYNYDDIPKMLNAVLNKYVELINNGNNIFDIAILTAKNIGNSGTNILNSCVQSIINPISEFDDFISIMVNDTTIKFKENDVVMNIKNNYNAIPINKTEKVLIANGQTGIIKSVNSVNNTMIIDIDGNKFEFEYADIRNLRLAYCFTIHKAQGSQFKNVIYITTKNDEFMTNANLMYVAVTRAQKNCYHYGDKTVINKKIKEQINLKRNTNLVELYDNIKENH